ncbi:hypothetical protein [Mesorhizobium qingshengii]|uniref:hypothetical protein n=1 Tax=Mesorhizobium qingshengii TaxID=1165689 RepID=UPI000B813D81|nr:hypothetical protein [Mesorhizobium qingshengii]
MEESYARTVATDSAIWKPLDGQNSVSSIRGLWLGSNPKRPVLRLIGLAKSMAAASQAQGRAKQAGIVS